MREFEKQHCLSLVDLNENEIEAILNRIDSRMSDLLFEEVLKIYELYFNNDIKTHDPIMIYETLIFSNNRQARLYEPYICAHLKRFSALKRISATRFLRCNVQVIKTTRHDAYGINGRYLIRAVYEEAPIILYIELKTEGENK